MSFNSHIIVCYAAQQEEWHDWDEKKAIRWGSEACWRSELGVIEAVFASSGGSEVRGCWG